MVIGVNGRSVVAIITAVWPVMIGEDGRSVVVVGVGVCLDVAV